MISLRHKATLYQFIGLSLILLLAIYFRFLNLNWDEGAQLHPDERFIVYVLNSISWTKGIGEYFDTAHSSLNPHNTGYEYYVYGTLPLIAIKALHDLFGSSGISTYFLPARLISAIADTGTVALTAITALSLAGPLAGLIAGLLGACCVLQIQLAHFGTFDSSATFFSTLAIYLAMLLARHKEIRAPWVLTIAFGAATGLAGACKLNTLLVGLWLIPALLYCHSTWRNRFMLFLLGGTSAFLFFRVAQPYFFMGPGLFGFQLNPRTLTNYQSLMALTRPDLLFPPSIQWIGRGPLFALKNMTIWGQGILVGVFVLIAWITSCATLIHKRDGGLLVLTSWVIGGFLFFGVISPTPAMRYQLPLYPALFILGGWAFSQLWNLLPKASTPKRRIAYSAAILPALVFILSAPAWAYAFTRIYTRQHPRIEAMKWVTTNIPLGKYTAVYESRWDETLPLWIEDMAPYRGIFTLLPNLEPYEPDSPTKAKHLAHTLSMADYVLITSNRQWSSLGRLPESYPLTNRLYAKLLGCSDERDVPDCYRNASEKEQVGPLGFKILKTFSSYPTLAGIEINDQASEEAFTVYDHPKVFVLYNDKKLQEKLIYRLLTEGITFDKK